MKTLLCVGAVVVIAAAIIYVIHLELENTALKCKVSNLSPRPPQGRIGFA